MENYSNVQYWKECPDRDEVLTRVYAFIRALKMPDNAKELQSVFVKDVSHLRQSLNDGIRQHLSMSIDDEQWEEFESKDLSFEIDDPATQDEDLISPEFSGTSYTLKKNEDLSVKLSFHTYITPIRLHFQLVESDELYYLRVSRLTVE